MHLKRGLRLLAYLKASGNHAIPSTRATNAAVKRGCGDGEFGSSKLQGVLSLAMSSLVTGTFGAFAEGLALYAASMDSELRCPAQDSERRCRPRSQFVGVSVREDTASILQASACRPVNNVHLRSSPP
jgi:hypothetical protein